jgi:hypothetical protein
LGGTPVSDYKPPVGESPPSARSDKPLTFSEVLNEVRVTLPRIRAALERQHKPPVERLALRFDEVAAVLGVSRRLLERERAAGRFPAADRTVGRVPLWKCETVRDWLDRGGRPS